MKKRLLIAVGVAVSALALAVVVVQGARGRGVAVNQQGVPATFAMDVVKRTSGDRVDVRGPFTFAVPRVSVTHPELSIHMRNAARFERTEIARTFPDGQWHAWAGVRFLALWSFASPTIVVLAIRPLPSRPTCWRYCSRPLKAASASNGKATSATATLPFSSAFSNSARFDCMG
ncbi:MAG: hypothetical protein UZ18_ATM001000608 [Armatimonadetes bacterium OLB18]|nr:MAG: hypothetical protein UZ18_ATM001000608 [Armatimonadetes bacterium OLB18]